MCPRGLGRWLWEDWSLGAWRSGLFWWLPRGFETNPTGPYLEPVFGQNVGPVLGTKFGTRFWAHFQVCLLICIEDGGWGAKNGAQKRGPFFLALCTVLVPKMGRFWAWLLYPRLQIAAGGDPSRGRRVIIPCASCQHQHVAVSCYTQAPSHPIRIILTWHACIVTWEHDMLKVQHHEPDSGGPPGWHHILVSFRSQN